MKILHTSDWHLGKRLCDKPRLDEQAAVLDEIARIADDECVDVVIVAGDVFDTYNPSAEAESLFYRAAVRLASGRILVAVAGNHDDADRLCAPHPLAAVNRIYLGDDFSAVRENDLTGGKGFLRYEKNGERLNLALLSYPSETRERERFDSYTELVCAQFARAAEGFGEGFNMAVAHLFMAGGEQNGTDERMLGAAVLVPTDVVPACDYCALGHVHKPTAVSKARNIVYSGSILNYHFDETGHKSVAIIDTADKSWRRVELSAGKPLLKLNASSAAEALAALENAGDAFVRLLYDGAPLTAAETAALRAVPSFCDIQMTAHAESAPVVGRVHLEPAELFRQFYRDKKGGDPPEELAALFLSFFTEGNA